MKKLRVNAYLRVEVGGKYKDEAYYGIDRYEEVKPEDIPKKAKEKLDKKTNYIEVTIQWSAPHLSIQMGQTYFFR
ncbi:hypothetical protein ABEY48_12370 [Bacillus mycoides]|uniref:hypothetical protein n=1 Tax=Bacillus mycoides TaxID=1405 RepID=UPI003D1A0C78